jgi:hypothetical protein
MIDALLATDWIDMWMAGDWWDALFQPYFIQVPRSAVILILGMPMSLALWIQSGSLGVPAVPLILFAGLLLGGAPPGASVVGYLLAVVAVAYAYREVFNA